MNLPLVVESILGLSGPQQIRFQRFLDSPYFNTESRLTILAQWIVSVGDSFSREAAHDLLFQGEPFHYERITNFLSYLQRQFETFLSVETFSQDPHQLLLWGMKGAANQPAERLFTRLNGKYQRLQAPTLLTEEEFLHQRQEVLFLQNQQHLRLGLRSADENLEARGMALYQYSLLSRLSNMCQWLTIQTITGRQESHWMEQELADLQTTKDPHTDHPLIELYRLILGLLIHPDDDERYQHFRRALDRLAGFDPDRKTLYQYAQNYCIQRANRGATFYLSELFLLYQEMLHAGFLYNLGFLSASDIKNIVSLGLRLKEYDWVEQFLSEQQASFPPSQAHQIQQYNLAYLALEKGQPGKAMKLLATIDFDDIYYSLGARVILAKCYYHLRDLDGLESSIHAFGTWLRRNKQISGYQRKVHLNLLTIMKKIAVLRATRSLYTDQEFEQKTDLIRKRLEKGEITNISWVRHEVDSLLPEEPS